MPGRMTASRRILILAPHPDDEVASCGIAALRARAAGARVFVLYLTTGVPERAALWAWQRPTQDARVRRRREETQLAGAVLGLAPAGFRDVPSRRLRVDLDRAAGDLAAVILRCAAEALWVPAFEGGHQDHDCANALAASFAGRLPVWEFAAYNFAGGRVRANRFATERGGEVAIEATAAEAPHKRAALGCYASERANLRHIGVEREFCRPLPAYDYGAPPASGPAVPRALPLGPVPPSADRFHPIGRGLPRHRELGVSRDAAAGDAARRSPRRRARATRSRIRAPA
jgi:N-acetylglucosamine malate deacetylase 1